MAKTPTTAATNAPAAAPTAPAAPVKPESKMSRAKKLYDEIFSPGYDLEGKSQRQVFTARAISEIGLTSSGANTYFQNISNDKKEPGTLYKYNRTEKKPGAEGTEDPQAQLPGAAPTRGSVKSAERQVAADLTKRWQCLNARGNVVNSFGTRKAAEEYVAAGPKGMKVLDSTKKAS